MNINKLSDFPLYHLCPDNNYHTYYIKLSDRIISLSIIENTDFVISLNTPFYKPEIPYSSPSYTDFTSWDNTLLSDFFTTNIQTAIEKVNQYLSISKLPNTHIDYPKLINQPNY